MTRRALTLAAVLIGLSGCASPDVLPAGEPRDESSSAAAAAPLPPQSPEVETPGTASSSSPAPPVVDERIEEYPELDVTAWEHTADDALRTATTVAGVYLNPSSPTWWVDLSALLSPQAATVYGHVDPAVVPTGQVTGDPVVTHTAGDGLLATVRVPTSIGALDILLTRATAQDGGGWEAEQIIPTGTP